MRRCNTLPVAVDWVKLGNPNGPPGLATNGPNMYWKRIPYALLAIFMTVPADADVTDAAANGFSVRQSTVITAETQVVYATTIDRISEWWESAHTISGDGSNLYIDARPHGCLCERLGPDGGLVHMTVTFVNPGVILRFTGGLGPLGLMGVSGNMTWEFEAVEGGTRVTWNYAVGGYLDGGLDAVAPAVDSVLTEQLRRLKSLVESGSAAGDS